MKVELFMPVRILAAVLIFVNLNISTCSAAPAPAEKTVISSSVVEGKFSPPAVIEGKFSPDRWRNAFVTNQNSNFSREDEFRRFLQEHNVFGQSHTQIAKLLGSEDELPAYTIARGSNFWRGFFIHYTKGTADKWCLLQGVKKGPWVTEDSVWTGSGGIIDTNGKHWAYVPKARLSGKNRSTLRVER